MGPIEGALTVVVIFSKMFGSRTAGTRRMMRDLYSHRFDRLTFVKLISSRPASAEMYLVCIGYAGRGPVWDGLG